MNTIQCGDLTVTIKKSRRRKTMAIKVKNEQVSVYIPHYLPLKQAREFIIEKQSWIQTQLGIQAQRQTIEKTFTHDELFLYLGHHYPLQLIEQKSAISLKLQNDTFCCFGRHNRIKSNAIRTSFINWYKQQANEYLTQRTSELAETLNLDYRSITIKTYTARWGSCSIRGDLHFNWKLILAPADIIDYVIIHELCHLKHHNHSSAFWQLVTHYYPDVKKARLWLNAQGNTLEI